tara:strand:+ start:1307 stop:8068 length:6762 start_codon:yes stop_codon:yes gene_type:complete
MSQQRSCCCGVDQNFELECLHGDKLTPYPYHRFANQPDDVDGDGISEYYGPPRPRYRKDSVPLGTQAAHRTGQNELKPLGVFPGNGQTIRYNTIGGRQGYKETRGLAYPDAPYQGRDGLGLSETPETSGMGCMLCHGSLIMSFKAKRFSRDGTLADGGFCSFNEAVPSCRTQVTYYSSAQRTMPEEEPMYVLYTALKDVWYFERGPTTLPYTLHDETPPPYFANNDTDTGKWVSPENGGNLGVRKQPYLETGFGQDDCKREVVFPPTPTDADALCHPELSNCTNPANVYFSDRPGEDNQMLSQLNKAWKTKCGGGYENRDPELAQYNSRFSDEQSQQVVENYVCTSLTSNSHPWYRWYNEATGNNGCPGTADGFQGSQFGSPCFGSYQPGVSSWQMYQCRAQPYLRHLGDLLTYGNGLRTFRSPGPELFTPTDEQLNPTGEPENITLPNNQPLNGSNLFTNAYAGQFGRLFRCRVWVKADMFQKDGKFPCQTYGGEKTAYHPSKTNRKMNIPSELGGYSRLQKTCSSGPSVLIYACAGVPVLSSDVRELFDNGDLTPDQCDRLLKIYLANNEDGFNGVTTPEWNNCFILPEIEEALGESGKFVAKDWRPDQLQKWNTLENQFQTITAEAIADEVVVEGDPDFDAVKKYSEGATLAQAIRDYITPIEVEGEDGTITLVEHELLPVQKSGREFLSYLINRAVPKQWGKDEVNRPGLSEMADYQATEYLGRDNGFAIDAYDPWHPKNSGDETGWKPLGLDRAKNHPITFRFPDGTTDTFEFRYPLRAAYRAYYVDPISQTSPYDPTPSGDEAWRRIVPKWEEELFEAWYKNNPIYIHSVPGGWSYAGLGTEHSPLVAQKWSAIPFIKDNCMDSTSGPHNLCNTLDSIWQLERDEFVTNLGEVYGDGVKSAFDKCDGFPNYTYMQAPLPGTFFWTYGAQLRNKPAKERCRTVSSICTPPGCSFWTIGGEPCTCTSNGTCSECCGMNLMGPTQNGNASCYSSPGCFGLNRSPAQGVLRNCCNVFNDGYAGRSAHGRKLIGKATAGILEQQPSSISQRSSKLEIDSWNLGNPSQSMNDESLYGTRCSESGGCPPSYKCCCPSGCGGDCFCIPEKLECETPPCSGQNSFRSPCCESFGSCCYVDENGRLKCVDNISEEECIARKSIGGLDGTFNRNRECGNGPCNTTITRGSCFYTDKLLDHQVCRDTTKETCAELSGEFKENQLCSDFPDKITTAYETIADRSGAKPQFSGDRSCGRFGFSVNCCTEEFDEATGTTIRTCEPKCLADCDIANGNSRIVSNCESCQPGEEGELGHCCTLHGYCKPNTTKADCWGIWGPGTKCDGETCINEARTPRGKIDLDLQYDSKTNWPNLANDVYKGIPYKRDNEGNNSGLNLTDFTPTSFDRDNRDSVRPDNRRPEDRGMRIRGTHAWDKDAPPYRDIDTGDSAGGGEESGEFCEGCQGANPLPGPATHLCLNRSGDVNIAGRHAPTLDFQSGKETGGCGIRENPIFANTCVIKSLQVTKIGFRHVTFTSVMDDFGLDDGTCPAVFKPTGTITQSCCDYKCNPAIFSDAQACNAEPGSYTKGLQDAIHALEVTVYPYKIRCKQMREVGAGFWKCGILDEFVSMDQVTDYAVGVAGVQDWLTCHQIVGSRDGVATPALEYCTDPTTACGDRPDDTCQGKGGGDVVNTLLFDSQTVTDGYEVMYAPNDMLPSGFCPNYSRGNLRTAQSIPFPDQGNGEQFIYGPKWGMQYIPRAHCASGNYKESNIRPRSLPPGTLRDCAEFYQDKLLCNIGTDDFYDPPPPYTDLIFHDYGGVTAGDIDHWMCQDEFNDGRANWFKGASAEYVDAFFDDSKNPNEFWIKKEFPGLQYIRLFGAGCYDIPGSFGGGRGRTAEINGVTYNIGGDFAGTMVLNFGTTTEFQSFDDSYGAENLSLKFLSKVLNQPPRNPIGGIGTDFTHTFIAQPSFNFYKQANFNGPDYDCSGQENSEDPGDEKYEGCPPFSTQVGEYSNSCSYQDIGWLNGRGLTYANISNSGFTAEYTGKVYEFCSFLDVNKSTAESIDENDPNELGGQLKPIFQLTPPADNPLPHYSGVRGPLTLFARNEDGQSTYDMSVDLSLTSEPPPGGNTCGACYGQLGEQPYGASAGNFELIRGLFGRLGYVNNPDADLNPRIKENCINYITEQGDGITDWHNTLFVPGYSGITTDGAKGCCTHRTGDPFEVEEGSEPSQQPCNQWQEAGEELHENPARTYGQGDCTCDENP